MQQPNPSRAKSKLFDPETQFVCLPIVWATVIVLFAIAYALGWEIMDSNPELLWSLKTDAMDKLFPAMKLPLGIATLIIPLLALYAAAHRSSQTVAQLAKAEQQLLHSQQQFAHAQQQLAHSEKQYEMTSRNNDQKFTLDHMKHFEEHAEAASNSIKNIASFNNKRRLYKTLFPNINFLNHKDKKSTPVTQLENAMSYFFISSLVACDDKFHVTIQHNLI